MNAKVSGEKYTVKEMEQADFLNTKPLIDGKNWTSATNGEKVMWTKIMEVKASNSHPNKLLFKYEFDEEYLELNTEQVINNRPRRGGRRGRGRGAGRGELTQEVSVSPGICQNIPELQRAYGQPIPVTKALHSDLMSLCKKIDIPSHYHPFYESLIYEAESVAVNQINEDSSSSD
ncbi:hypothetical protein O0L34_g3629 [Tuta absoluta]|nr:hypothetical protein O0L34_g3629 [Tuta absoluta]